MRQRHAMRRRIGSGVHLPFSVIVLLALILGTELTLQAAEWGWIGTGRWRTLAYQNGAFWPGLLRDWAPNYPLQPATMFASYASLHADLGHAAGNALTIALLGPRVCDKVGQRGFVWICAATAIGGGLGFTWLSQTSQPMVGASGVVFGLAGALTGWLWDRQAPLPHTLLRMTAIAGLLVVLNGVVWWALDGLLAWETHLGGFVAGFLMVFALPQGRPDTLSDDGPPGA